MGKKRPATSDPDCVYIFADDLPPEEDVEEEPMTVLDHISTVFDAGMNKGHVVQIDPKTTSVKLNYGDLRHDICGVVTTVGDSMYMFNFTSPLHRFILKGPADKNGDVRWTKKVFTNFDMQDVFAAIDESQEEGLLEWKKKIEDHVILQAPKKRRTDTESNSDIPE